ncbi:MAG TPA: hypothetical protein VMW53_02015 [archaeon]|nr:hypothetical protein [archaeon]
MAKSASFSKKVCLFMVLQFGLNRIHLTPYFSPSVRPDIRIAGDSGGIVFKTGRIGEYDNPVCERVVPYVLKLE